MLDAESLDFVDWTREVSSSLLFSVGTLLRSVDNKDISFGVTVFAILGR